MTVITTSSIEWNGIVSNRVAFFSIDHTQHSATGILSSLVFAEKMARIRRMVPASCRLLESWNMPVEMEKLRMAVLLLLDPKSSPGIQKSQPNKTFPLQPISPCTFWPNRCRMPNKK